MSYQVLARKWRPKNFNEMVGQEHVLPALVHALDHKRLHHAYLFTGTRGIGKTTVARIFAKCLNCESGVTSTPCNTCNACQEIDAGRFIDLIEVDAASRTKVEDTRELLDNVQYAPSKGRYKVYLIDEVHMLSGHSFNALLKTLEEPPEYVKFLLATTDPEKLPVTVLSRCLQFHLKPLTESQITAHLSDILTKESIQFENAALSILAKAAHGSLRDSLSLLDQAIAFGDGEVKESLVCNMLGVINQSLVLEILDALRNGDAEKLIHQSEEVAKNGYDFSSTLDQLTECFHNIGVNQFIENQHPTFQQYAEAFSKEDIQLYYQICLMGKKDLSLAPNPRIGFEMSLLRLLAFEPGSSSTTTKNVKAHKPSQVSKTAAPKQETSEWSQLLASLNLSGMQLAIASQCELVEKSASKWVLALNKEQAPLLNETIRKRLEDSINQQVKEKIALDIIISDKKLQTPSSIKQKNEKIAFESASKSLESDGHINQLKDKFGAKIQKESIESIGDGNN